jgi:hypothetical protein
MGPFRFLRRLSSRLFGWGKSDAPPAAVSAAPEGAVDPFAGLQALLTRERAIPCPDAGERVAHLEERYGLRIPDDFRHYLLHIAPLQDAVDDEMTAWWSLDRIRNIPDDLTEMNGEAYQRSTHTEIAAEEGRYLLFADYLVWCWGWAVCCSDGPNRGRVALIGDPDGFVADSFTEFVERYLLDPAGMANTFPPKSTEASPAAY